AGDMVDELAHALFPQGSFLGPFLNATAIYGIRYVLLAGIAFFAGYAMRREGKLQSAMPRGAQIRREIGYSAMTVLVFSLVIGATSSIREDGRNTRWGAGSILRWRTMPITTRRATTTAFISCSGIAGWERSIRPTKRSTAKRFAA